MSLLAGPLLSMFGSGAAGAAGAAGGGIGGLFKNQLGTAISAGQLLFGENNLFSGKARQASREMGKAFQESQNKGINQGYYDVLAGQRARAQQGMGEASKALAFQQSARAANTALAGADSARNRLATIQGIAGSGNNLALGLAAQNENIQRQNQGIADQSALNVAGLEDENWQRKMNERNAYWGNRKAESNASISSALAGLGKSLAANKTAAATTSGTTTTTS